MPENQIVKELLCPLESGLKGLQTAVWFIGYVCIARANLNMLPLSEDYNSIIHEEFLRLIGETWTPNVNCAFVPTEAVMRLLWARMFHNQFEGQLKFPAERRPPPLSRAAVAERAHFAQYFQAKISAQLIDPRFIIFTDECIFSTGFQLERWLKAPYKSSLYKTQTRRPPAICVWCGVNYILGLIGPIILELDIANEDDVSIEEADKRLRESLTSYSYNFTVQLAIKKLIAKIGTNQYTVDQFWWQQDGASIHLDTSTFQLLTSHFGERIIAQDAPLNCDKWPIRSQDLNPVNYWLWPLIKRLLAESEPAMAKAMVNKVYEICNDISVELVQDAIEEFPVRLNALQEANGRHFEHNIRRIKRDRFNWLGVPTIEKCETCMTAHPCECITCLANCKAIYLDIKKPVQEADDLEWDQTYYVTCKQPEGDPRDYQTV